MRRTCVLRIRQIGRSIPSASFHPSTPIAVAGDSRRPEHHHHQIRLGFPHPCLSQVSAAIINTEAVPSAHVFSSQSGLADLRERNGSDSNPARVPRSDSDPDIQSGPSTRVHGRATLQPSTCRRSTLLGATCATSARAISSAALRSRYGVETKARGWSWHQLRHARVNGSEVLKIQHTQSGRGGATIQVLSEERGCGGGVSSDVIILGRADVILAVLTWQAELRDVQTGLKTVERLRTTEGVERVFAESKQYTFLYRDGDQVVVMDPSSFEQVTVDASFFGDGAVYLVDGMAVSLQTFDGAALSASVPAKVTCTVREAEPFFKSQTAVPSFKKVTLENGQVIQVPGFVSAGDRVVVETADHSYVTRAKDG